jgi:hypothetical protein
MIMAKGLEQSRAHPGDFLFHLGQLGPTRQVARAIHRLGDLVDVRANLPDLAKQAGKLRSLNGRLSHGTKAGVAKRQKPQQSADAQAGLSGNGLYCDPLMIRTT